MNIAEIKRRFDLLKTANASNYCLVSELAKELRASKTDLMQFILDNPKLFHTEDVYSYKKKTYTTTIWGNKFKETRTIKDKVLGLGIKEVYINPEDNFRTDEWLQKQIVEKAKYISISAFDNYGRIEGYFIEIDNGESECRYSEWRNTEAKVKELQSLGIVHKDTFYFGGYGDCSEYHTDYVISLDGLEKLKADGWTFNQLKPLSK